MPNTDSTTSSIITANSLPAILIGGPPNAGKSVLTYNLTLALRRCNIPHYVFRANPDIEGDWFLQGDVNTVRQIQLRVCDYRHWSDIFRAFVCRDLALRQLPLIVDLGGLPREADTCIFQVCTHSILLLKDEDENATGTWRHFTATNGLLPLAEIRSQLHGDSTFVTQEPTITGTITGLMQGSTIHEPVFDALVKRVCQLFRSYTPAELEKRHIDTAPMEDIVHLTQHLKALDPTASIWTSELLRRLIAELPTGTAMAVYGRGPNWLYGALALHAGTQPFYQFDARLGWVTPPMLHTSASAQLPQSVIRVEEDQGSDPYVIHIHPVHNYLDYSEAEQLVFPEPPSQRGVIVSGKLPLWLFTALARFYEQRDVPWIALNDARDNRPIVIYSQVASYPIGKILPKLV